MWIRLLCLAVLAVCAESAGAGAARLVCYVENARVLDGFSECTHLVYAGNERGNKLDALLKDYRKNNPKLKIVLRVTDEDKDLRALLKSKYVQGLELSEVHRSLNKTKALEYVDAARKAVNAAGSGPLFLALPAHPELLAKYYDLRQLMKKVDLLMVQTHALGLVKKMTYHPSRLSGLWDMMNTDSVVDLVVGLGVPASKIVISLPATARRFTLQNETLSTPGSPAVDDEPKEIDQAELCRTLRKGRWTLERDQDLSAPYAFKNKTWISFEDSSSVDVKGKYTRVRGLAGLALHKADRDVETPCGPTLKSSLAKVLNQQSRAPRAAVLRSLEHEILSAPGHARVLDALQVSPYRITQVVDSDGVIHSIREDTRTEFSCSRQGYFVHPRSCARFYRCVKFDQLSADFTVFEFDCPAGLAFDSRYEVCVWPGSLPHSQACPGSSEIAPVPQTRFVCPAHEGYYVDPENCRWFFACIDHGKSPLSAYEFRCPFGLGFDPEKLKCDWPWLVPSCGNIGRYEAQAYGFSSATLTGAVGYQGQTADAVNVAAHNSLVSGASLNNLVGIQGGFLTTSDGLDSNFIASQELANGAGASGHVYQIGHGVGTHSGNYQAGQSISSISQSTSGGNYNNIHDTSHDSDASRLVYQGVADTANSNLGLVQTTKYSDEGKYTSGSLILDDYRLPNKVVNTGNFGSSFGAGVNGYHESGIQNNDQITLHQSGAAIGQGQTITANEKTVYGTGQEYQGSGIGNIGLPTLHQSSAGIGLGQTIVANQKTGYSIGQEYQGSGIGNIDQTSLRQNGAGFGFKQTTLHQNGDTGNVQINLHEGDSVHLNSATLHNVAGVISNAQAALQQGQGQYTNDFPATNQYSKGTGAYSTSSLTSGTSVNNIQQSGLSYDDDNSGAYVHDPSGDYAEPYKHIDSPALAYTHSDSGYKHSSDYYDYGKYSGSSEGSYDGKYVEDNSGQYNHDNSGAYVETTSLHSGNKNYVGSSYSTADYSGSYNQDNSAKYFGGVYNDDGREKASSTVNTHQNHGSYSNPQAGEYISNSKAYTGVSHTLTAGAVNVGLVGKTTLVDADYINQHNYQIGNGAYSADSNTKSYSHGNSVVHHTLQPGHVSLVAQPAVSIHHIGTDSQNLDGYSIVTTPTSSGVPTTATPFAVTTSLPTVTTYKTKFIPEAPKTSIKQIFGYNEPAITPVQPTVVSVKQQFVTPGIQITDYDHSLNDQYQNKDYAASIIASQGSAQSVASGYEYPKPNVKFEDGASYTTAAPVVSVSTYRPQGFSYGQQTLHKVESVGFEYSTPSPINEKPFKKLIAYTTGTSESTFAQPTVSTYTAPQSYSHQTVHNIHNNKVASYSPVTVGTVINGEHETIGSGITFEQPKTLLQYTTAQPTISLQPIVSTYQPQTYSQQTLHKVDASQVQTYSQDTSPGYEYPKTAVNLNVVPKVAIYSTFSPVVASTSVPAVSTYRPQSYSQQTVHRVKTQNILPVPSTSLPHVELAHQQQAVTIYENPILKYTQKVSPVTYLKPTAAVYTQSYQPAVQQHQVSHVHRFIQHESSNAQQLHNSHQLELSQNLHSQPEIQRDIETLNTAKSYSDASLVSHQTFHLSNSNNQYKTENEKDLVFVSTTPATLAYEEHYAEYENPEKISTYVAPQYIPPKSQGQQTYSVSTPSIPIAQQKSSIVKQTSNQYDYKGGEYIPPKTEYQQSYSISTASTPIIQQQNYLVHQSNDHYDYKPVEYENLESSAPVQVSFSTSHADEPSKQSLHFTSFPAATVTKQHKQAQISYQPEIQVAYKAEEYLPPVISTGAPTVSTVTPVIKSTYRPRTHSTVSTSREYLPPVELASVSTQEYSTPKIQNIYLPQVTPENPLFRSTTQIPIYVKSTTYKAPEYLPPVEEGPNVVNFETFGFKNIESSAKINLNPYQEYSITKDVPVIVSTTSYPPPIQRKQNIVVETAKNLLGFGTVGPNAGLVSPVSYTTAAPVVVSSTESYSLSPRIVTSTYTPIKQELVEVTPSTTSSFNVERSRTKPKVAVVTKINDFNPLLVRKLGAVCSCQSPVLILKGKRPVVTIPQGFDDYRNDYDDSNRGDIDEGQYSQKPLRLQRPVIKTITTAPVISSTSNPIIVPDDSYYQDYEESVNNYKVGTPKSKEIYSENFVSSTVAPITYSTTEKLVRIRPRIKATTPAPTYKTVLLKQEESPAVIVKQSNSETSAIDSQAFDRYGPGGWRSRDETLQGTVDCQRAGLFRHPKQCNKFYACRWDCTKQRFTLHVFNCPVQLSFDPNIGACNWPSQGPACQGDILLTNTL